MKDVIKCMALVSALLSIQNTNAGQDKQSADASSSPLGQTAKTFAEWRRGDDRTVSSSAALSRIFARVLPGYTFKRSKMKGCRVDRVSPDGFWTYRGEDSKTNEVSWSDFYKRYPANFNEAINWFSSNEGTNVFGTCRSRVVFMRHAANVIDEYCSEISGAKERCAKLRSQADELTQSLRKSATVASARPTSDNRQKRKTNNGKGTETVDGITWQYELVNGVAVVGSVDGISQHAVADHAIGGNVRIPARLGGCEVGCIGPSAFAGCGRILTVDIPDSITNIGKLAFWDCRSLKKLVIPPHVTGFGDGVLAQCNALRSLTIPAGVTNFAEDNLSLANLREIHLDERNPVLKMNNGIFWNSRTGELMLCFKDVKGDLILPQGVKRIKRWQFKDCKGLTSVEIPEGVTEIGEYAFWCCEGMKSVKLPKSLRSIAEGAFYHCVKLESVEIPDGVTEIPYRAFEDCWKLKTVSLPFNVKSIGERAFSRCRRITFRSGKAGERPHSSKFRAELLPKEGLIADFDFEGQPLSNKVNSAAAVSGIQMVAEDGCLNFDGRYQGRGGWPWDIVFPELDFDGFTLAMSFFPEESDLIFHSLGLMSAYIGSECSICFGFQGKGKSLNSYVLTYPNEWNWFVLSVDMRNRSVGMVVNGKYCGTSALSDNYAWPVAQSTPNEIARSLVFGSPGNGSRFKGKIDDVLVLNRPLSADEMQRIANGQPPLPQVKTEAKSIGEKASTADPVDRSDAWTLRWARKNRSCYWNASISKDGVVLEAHCDGHEICLQPLSYVAEKLDLSAPVVSAGGEKYVITGIGAKENFLQGYCSSHKTVLREVILPETVKNLYDYAFKGSMLQEIFLPTNLVQIGKEAFRECHGLTSITIPGNVKRVSSGAFSHCDNLKEVVLSEGVQDVDYFAFGRCPRLVAFDIRGKDVNVNMRAFCENTSVWPKMMDLSKPVGPICVVAERKVPTGRFKDEWTDARSCVRWFYTACNDLAQIDRVEVLDGFSGHVEVPESIDGCYVEQNKKLFELLQRMPSLKEVTLNPSNSNFVVVGGLVCDKDQEVVVLCPRGAKEITLPANVRDVSSIFDYSSDLQTICVASGNRHFISRDGVLYDKEMTTLIRCPNAAKNVVIPDSVKIIGKSAFCGCKSLSEVRIPDSVTKIQAAAFSSCTGLCSVVLSKNLRCISRCMFSGCTSLKSITLPQSVREIDWGAFSDCSSLHSVLVDEANGVKCADGHSVSVEDVAFQGCGNLASIDLPGPDVQLFGKPFGGCTNLTELAFLPHMQHIWTGALKETGYYRAMSNGTPIVFHSRLMGVKEPSPAVLEIPSGVVEIAEAAFSGNKDLKSVVIPASVTNIECRAFSGCCQLETVTIPESVARIGYDSFSNCTNLKTVITAMDDTNRLARIEKAFGREMKVSESGRLIVLPKQEEKTKPGGSAKKDRAISKRQTSSERVWRDPQTGIDWRISVKDGKASLGSGWERALVDVSYAGDLIIPERLDGCPVENVYHRAFEGCTNLTSICIPRTVGQFRVQLSSFVSLTNVTVDAGNARYRSRGRFLTSDNGKVLCDVCAGGVKSISIPDGIEEISWGCFWGSYWIEDVRIPSSVRSVGAEAFSGMRGLARKHDPDNRGFVVLDGWLIPTAHVKRRKLTVPNGVRHIAHVDSSSSVWPDVYEVKLPEGLETIGQGIFSGANVETIEFPKSLRSCDGFGKKWHSSGRSSDMKRPLRNVVFNSGDVRFSMPDSVQNVTFAAGVTDVGVAPEGQRRSGLSGGEGVKIVKFPAGLLSIRSLPDFPELTEVTIPSSVTNIGKSVFQKCEKLKTVGVEKNGAVELVPIDEFRRKWNLLFTDGCLHLTDAKTGIRWIVRSGAPYKKGSVCTLVGIEDGQDPSVLTIPETIAGMSVVRVDWDYFLQSKSRSWRTEATSDAPPARTNVLSAVELRIPRTLDYVDLSAVARIFPVLQSLVVEEGGDKYGSSDGVLCESGTAVYCPRNRKGRVVLGEGIWRIDRAFSNCTNLTEVVLPASLRAIDSGAFSGCLRLEKLHLPERLRSISAGAFDGCVKLFEKSKRYDGFYVLDGWAINPQEVGEAGLGGHDGTLVLPDGLRGVACGTFSGCTNLLSVTFPKSLTYIGDGAFAHANIRTLELPEGVRSVGYRAFWGCTNLMSVSIPSSIGEWDSVFFYGSCGSTFAGCTRLKSVHLAEGLRVLPFHGFSGCSGLESVAIPSSVTNDIGRFGSTAPSDWFSSCPSLREVCVSPENPRYKSIDGVVYAKDGKSLLCCPDGKRSVAIPDGVEIIGDYAFDKCSAIETIELPMSVTNIGKHAFYGCSGLKSVTIPEGVKQIGDSAFGNCRRLTEIRMPSTVREIGLLALEGDSVPERILTAPGDAERILGLVLTNGHSKLARMRSFQARYGRQSKDVGDRLESRFVVEGDALVRTTSGFARWRDPETGIAWLYSVQGDNAVDVRTEFLEGYNGHLDVPDQLGGKQVSGLLGLYGGRDITSLSLPMSVTNVNSKALAACTKLKSVKMNVDGELKTIGIEDLRRQWNQSVPRKPAFRPARGNLQQGGLLRARRLQRQQQESAAKVQADAAKAQREADQSGQRAQLLAIQEELKRVREAKAAAEKQKGE